MKDIIRLPSDLGAAVRQTRKAAGLKATDVARSAGRSRDVLHRLERGDDVTVASLMDILRAMGVVLRLESAGLPTLAEMQQRFGKPEDDDDDAA
ncbi:helix-turn-helix domain-containing protein [Pseudorhodoferax sp. Leaf267]|uniref:helix-turn-helix domain-containing protein n=1 Tax=Pseudorhodoferax sp. Leaf267 TaxID=1736316 RepID=UPI0006F97DBF|nr:helix-turn-helix transcriptional regulator [Pseudorhodoferax sp. Leaf267]KQP14735.1 XRE family transcriptional regulator [Pseudorhodoferax sp. Leaf267]